MPYQAQKDRPEHRNVAPFSFAKLDSHSRVLWLEPDGIPGAGGKVGVVGGEVLGTRMGRDSANQDGTRWKKTERDGIHTHVIQSLWFLANTRLNAG